MRRGAAGVILAPTFKTAEVELERGATETTAAAAEEEEALAVVTPPPSPTMSTLRLGKVPVSINLPTL